MENNSYIYVYIRNEFIMAKQEITKLTSVKVIKRLYEEEFKRATFEGGLNFQRLVNRALDLYTKDDDFKQMLNTHTTLQMSGSQF